jgi:glycerophosphoryl diester phosphodiesterase
MDTLIIAHRGESYDAPENTLASVNLAWDRGAEAVEIDVHLSKDNKVVVIHDAKTKRIGGRNKKVKHQTLAELKELDVGSWKNNKYIGTQIPKLIEVLETVPSGKKIIIEVKSDIKTLPYLKEDIESSGLQNDQIEIISFNYTVIAEAKRIFSNNKVLFLADLDYNTYTKFRSPSVEKIIAKTKYANLDGLNVWAGKILTKEFAQKVKGSGLLLYVWTINDPNKAKELVSWGINGITTDRAQWMKIQLFE